jgi:hypothetical protein
MRTCLWFLTLGRSVTKSYGVHNSFQYRGQFYVMAIGQCVNCFTDMNVYIYCERINTEGNEFKLIKTFGFSIYSLSSWICISLCTESRIWLWYLRSEIPDVSNLSFDWHCNVSYCTSCPLQCLTRNKYEVRGQGILKIGLLYKITISIMSVSC